MPVNKKALNEYQKTVITPATMQRALLDARGELEDRDIFLSPAYHQQVNSLGRYLVGRTGRKDIAVAASVIWDEREGAVTAYTDNKRAVINAAYPKIRELKRRVDRHYCVMGMSCHEFAHCLFTDFTLLEEQYDAFMNGELYPHTPATTPENEYGLIGIQEAMSKGKRSREAIWEIYKSLDNSIEDGYIERSIVVLHQGDTKKSLKMLNEAFFGGSFMVHLKEKLSKNPELLSCKWSVFSNALLTLLKMGSVDIDPAYNDFMKDIHKRISDLSPRVMREVENSNALSRKELALDIILDNWDLIEDEIEYQMSTMSEIEKALSELTDEELSEILEDIISAILEGVGSDHDNHENSNGGIPIRVFIELPSPSQEGNNEGAGGGGEYSGDEANEVSSGAETNSKDNDDEENEPGAEPKGKNGDSDGSDGDGQDKKDGDSSASDSEDKSKDKSSDNDSDGDEESSNKTDTSQSSSKGGPTSNSKPTQGTAAATNTGESVTIRIVPDNEISESDDSFRKELSSVENELAHEAAGQKVEKTLQDTLQNNANFSATNDTWRIDVKRLTNVPQSGVHRHEYIWPKIEQISKSLKKELLKILNERRQGSKQTGLIVGRRLDTRSLYRTDEKYFSKKRLPNERPTVATALLIDQSGSMRSHAKDLSNQNLFSNKIQAASNAALLLYDFCTSLGFPIMVAGHTTEDCENAVSMEVMAAFQKVDRDDKYRICSAGAYGGNRDGTALNYMLTELKKRPEEIKLLFIVSDGLPSDYGADENGIQHLQEVLQDAHKSGVLTFAAALNEDVGTIKHIYGENMFEFTDLARMPRTLLNVMKRFIK